MIRLSNLIKRYDSAATPFVAVDNVNMEVQEGEICVLLGPSGCGKTTTLKMINRLIAPTSGKIYIDNKDTDLFNTVELRRNIGYVIQQIGLFPNMTVAENICVVPALLGWDKRKSLKRAEELLDIVALDPATFMNRYPKELSGGQQQRVGVARALAADPPVMLMDEPFGAIDPINRESIQDEFLKIQKQVRKTIMFVSHDIDEAVKMADKIAIFRAGKLEQFDTPDNVLAHPANDFVANFVGGDRTLKRLRLVKASQVASAAHCFVKLGASVSDAKAMMNEHGLEHIVMVDASNVPRGYLCANRLPDTNERIDGHVMPLPATLKTTDDLRIAVSLMFAHDVSLLACVDHAGIFQGYVTQRRIADCLGTAGRGA
jgi:osmoprotectant transport system ATP-binding protein